MMKNLRKTLALLLALCMAVSMLATTALAAPRYEEEVVAETPMGEEAQESAQREESAAPAAPAEIEETPAELLEEAEQTEAQKLQAALAAGGTVTLTGPVSIDATTDRISVSNEVVLDLNGQTINATMWYAIKVLEGGKLTVQDSVGGGKIAGVYNDANNSMVYVDGGEFTLESGELSVSSERSAYSTRALYVNKGTANITGGTITAAGEDTIGVATANATVKIGAVTITASGEGARAVSMLDGSTGDIKITGATLLATGKDAVCVEVGNYSHYSNKMTITQSTLNSTGEGSYGLYGRYEGTVEIKESTITAAGYGLYFWEASANIADTKVTSSKDAIYCHSAMDGKATIESGEFTGNVQGKVGQLTVNGGAFDVNVSKYVPEGKKQSLDGEVLPADQVTVSIAAVAQIGDTIYESLAEAFTAVNATEGADSVTMTILSDCAPTANEQLRITRDNVVIEGRQNRSGNYPTIDCGTYSCSGQAGVLVSGDNVTVKNLKVIAKGNSVDAIKVTKVDADALVQNVTLENLELTHKATWTFVNSELKQTTGHGLNLHGVDGVAVTDVKATGTKCGMSLANAKGVTVSGSEIGGKWGAIGMMYKEENPAYANPVTLTLGEGNTFTGMIYSERSTEAKDTVTLTADQTADIAGAEVVEGEYTLTTDAAAKIVKDGKATYYATLAEAVAAATDGQTVKLVKQNDQVTGTGVKLVAADAKNVTIDLNGCTYNVVAPHVGSTGYESQSFHFEKGNTVTLKNGTIKSGAPIVIQNYCDLTLEDLTIEGAEGAQYAVSCNAGNTTLTNVSISGTDGNFTALDVMHWHGQYPTAPTMTINNTADNTIGGKIDVYCYGNGADACESKATLEITGGTFTVDVSAYCAEGYQATENNGTWSVAVIPAPDPTPSVTYYTLTIHYVDGEGNEVAPSVTRRLSRSSRYNVASPAVEGMVPDQETVSGVMGREDLTVTVTYAANEQLVDPDVPLASGVFIDVAAGDWFAAAVSSVYAKELMVGVTANTFAPKALTTRSMVATILHRMESEPTAAAADFSDVLDGAWYAPAVNWANEAGLMIGAGNGAFGAEDHITREQLALTFYRYARFKGQDVTTSGDLSAFADGEETSDWAKEAMIWAVESGLFQGKGQNILDPKADLTRAELAAILDRFFAEEK